MQVPNMKDIKQMDKLNKVVNNRKQKNNLKKKKQKKKTRKF